jgi:TPR repeat protein
MLGTIFAKGVQGKPDYEQSVSWYGKAAEQRDRDGECGLAIRYALGQGVPVDLLEARRLFKAAADQGQLEAQYNLAVLSEEGKGGPVDQDAAAHYFQLAAEQGATKAQFRLGRLLASKQESPGDKVSAYRWLTLAQDSIKESSAALSDLRKSMNEQEIAEADREVDAWRIAHQARH